MAQKQTDPTLRTASIIANRMGDTALTYRNKAPNDKTYSATILGVNRKFTDDVTEDDITNKLAKFNIPETVGEGENNYYTFKINGEYYCKQQLGDFKLYDDIMVYVPNGVWSNMYFDYADGVSHLSNSGSGGNSSSLPNYIIAVEKPGGESATEGNLWIVINDETITEFTELTKDTFVAMYEYKASEENVSDWRQVKVCVSKISADVDVNDDDYWIKLDDEGKFAKISMWEIEGSVTDFYEIYPNPEREIAPDVFLYNFVPMQLGDYWVRIDSYETKNFLSLWKYESVVVENEEEQTDEEIINYDWVLLYNVRSGNNFHVSVNKPTPLKDGDYLVIMPDDVTITQLFRYHNKNWQTVNFQYGSSPPAPTYGLYYGIIGGGALRYILSCESGTWQIDAPTPCAMYINEAIVPTIMPDDYWIQITDETNKIAVAAYQYRLSEEESEEEQEYEWARIFGFGASLGKGLEYDGEGKIQAKLGDGLKFDSNGAITIAYDPVINIEHALVYKKAGE